MDYERILDESLFPAYERLKSGLLRLIDEGKISRGDAARVLPELRESEDERIRKAIIQFFRDASNSKTRVVDSNTFAEWATYLEKQKEQKPVEWSEVELEFRGEKVTVKRQFYRDNKGRGYSTAELDEEVAWNALRAWCEKKGISLYDLYPKVEWSDEDEEMLEYIVGDVNDAKQLYTTQEAKGMADKEIAWLKSLRPRPSWKPSEEQMKALYDTSYGGELSPDEYIHLTSLYEQLQKL